MIFTDRFRKFRSLRVSTDEREGSREAAFGGFGSTLGEVGVGFEEVAGGMVDGLSGKDGAEGRDGGDGSGLG